MTSEAVGQDKQLGEGPYKVIEELASIFCSQGRTLLLNACYCDVFTTTPKTQ